MREHRRALMVLVLFFSTPAMAESDKMLLELRVNGSSLGTAFVLIRHKHILIDAGALKRAQLPVAASAELMVGKVAFVDLTDYAKAGTIHLDSAAGRLTLDLPAKTFAGQNLELNSHAALLRPLTVPSAFVNYAFNAGTLSDQTSAYLDAGFAFGQGLLRDNPSWDATQGFSRGLTRFEYDDASHLRRLTLGDQYAYSTDGLGGSVLMGGIGVVRAFDLDPYLITFPQPTINGLLQAPGTLDIYKNGVLVGQREVAAGPFNLAGLGLGPGANNVSVVIHDPFGGTRTLQQNFYGANQVLAQGLSDYAFQAGVERTSTLVNSYESGRGVLLLRQNHGFTDSLTAGYRAEAENGLVNAGSSLSLRLPVGYLSTALASSLDDGRKGHGSSFAYQFSDRVVSFGAGLQTYSSGYARIGDDLLSASTRPRRVSYVNASWSPSSFFSLQASAGDIRYVSGLRQRNVGLNGAFNLPAGMSLLIGVNRQLNSPGDDDHQLTANLVIPLGMSSVGFNAGRDGSSGSTYGFSAQRSVPPDNGWGYSANMQNGGAGAADLAQREYQGRDGLLQLTGQRFGGQSSGNLLVSGSVIALDDHLYFGRALQSGYAVVQTPGMANVEITHENQPMGKTDVNGNLLVNNLLPYQANKLGIDQNSVPVEYQIDATQQTTSVPRMGGVVVGFGVHALHAVRGTLTLNGKNIHYGSATLAHDGTTLKTLIGLDGSFYFSDLSAGSYVLKARAMEGEMDCPFNVPARTRPFTRLGAVKCVAAIGVNP